MSDETVTELFRGVENRRLKEATELLPAWFTERMMTDVWSFGLLLVTGQMLHIEHIYAVTGSPGNVWIDVRMHSDLPGEGEDWHEHIVCSPTQDRRTASINAAHVVLAVELAST
jgi:hypothetical protein